MNLGNEFKYQTYFDDYKLTECPPKTYHPINSDAYRYIFEDLSNENNFKPVYLITPQRLNDEKDLERQCQGFGLSLYFELEGAENQYAALLKRNKNFHKIVGNKIALIKLTMTDGVASESNNHGNSHFTFHEYISVDLVNKIVEIVDI